MSLHATHHPWVKPLGGGGGGVVFVGGKEGTGDLNLRVQI